jgi:hypothetical protein
MTDAKHTPGHWALDDKTGSITWGNVDYGAALGAGGFVVASHSISRIPNHQSERLTEEHKANARLIAAAPDMLAALEDLLGTIRHHKNGHCVHCGRDNSGYLEDPCSDDCPGEKARAAIAKAKGGAA